MPPTQPGETPWYSWDQEPVQIGVYRRCTIIGSTRFSLWDGGVWRWNCASPAQAGRATDRSLIQTLPWCGLLLPPLYGYTPFPAAEEEPA